MPRDTPIGAVLGRYIGRLEQVAQGHHPDHDAVLDHRSTGDLGPLELQVGVVSDCSGRRVTTLLVIESRTKPSSSPCSFRLVSSMTTSHHSSADPSRPSRRP
jgi:hypothetical protein